MSALSAHIEERRSAAAAEGRPLLRLAAPSVISPVDVSDTSVPIETLFVWLRAGKLCLATSTVDNVTLTAGLVKDIIERVGGRVVVTDRAALRQFLRTLDRLASPAGRTASMQLRACSRIDATTKLVVLADALDARFWMPEGRDCTDIKEWKRALGAPSGPAGIRSLLAAAETSHLGEKPLGVLTTAATSIRRLTGLVTRVADKKGSKGAIDGFLAAEKLGDAWGVLRAFDPIGRHEAVAEGTMSRIKVTGRDERSRVLAVMSQPCRMRTGNVVLLDPHSDARLGTARLSQITYQAGLGLMGIFVPAPKVGKPGEIMGQAFAPMDRAVREVGELIIGNDPSIAAEANPTFAGARAMWDRSADQARPVSGRDVPLDVALAGGVGI